MIIPAKKTKFNIGQRVFLLLNNTVKEVLIREISCHESYRKDDESKFYEEAIIQYKVHDFPGLILYEQNLFETKQELLNSL